LSQHQYTQTEISQHWKEFSSIQFNSIQFSSIQFNSVQQSVSSGRDQVPSDSHHI